MGETFDNTLDHTNGRDYTTFSYVTSSSSPGPQVKIRAWLYRSRFSISYFVDRNDETLVVSVFDEGPRSVSIYRVRDKEFQRVFVDTDGNSCSYVPSLAHPHGSSKQDTTRI